MNAPLAKLAWQPVLFAEKLKRLDLLRLKAEWPCRSFSLLVYRNEPFEYVGAALAPFLAYCDLNATRVIGDYDDSLGFAGESDTRAEIILLWLDFARYRNRHQPDALAAWIGTRLAALRARHGCPILLADDDAADDLNPHLDAAAAKVPGVCIFSRRAVAQELGAAYWEKRNVGATRISGDGVLALARALSFGPLAGSLLPRIKAIATDLDLTLAQGVLGEDGIDGMVLTPEFRAVQKRLAAWQKDGLFLALVSRNQARDVEALFAQRADFPLRWEMFSARAIGWDDKSRGLQEIADTLRIAPDAILYIDDNPGELTQIGLALPAMPLLFAGDAAEVARALTFGPRLQAFGGDAASRAADALRADDLAANAERERIAASAVTPAEYFRSLGIRLDFAWSPHDQRARLYDLSRKTNQFNLALARFEEAEVARRLSDPQHAVLSFRLADRLSDSGVIGVLFARVEGHTLFVDELNISCRALGRRLEDVMIITGINRVSERFPGVTKIAFLHATGPRNQPARAWLAQFSGQALDADSGVITIDWEPAAMRQRIADLPVEIFWEERA